MAAKRATPRSTAAANTRVDFLPKIKLELVISDEMVDNAVSTIVKAAKTGKIGDGKVFISEVEEAVRIRTEEKGVAAV